jgi:hypothetical protein
MKKIASAWVADKVAWLVLASWVGQFALGSSPVHAGYTEIVVEALPTQISSGEATGSGNGTLDFILFTHETARNRGQGFDFDDANTEVATGVTDAYAETFLTSGADLKAFYELNFDPDDIREMVVFLDLNENNGNAADNWLQAMDVILNPQLNGVTDPVTGDVSSAEQNQISQIDPGTGGFSSDAYAPSDENGERLAGLSGPVSIPQVAQGGGRPDYVMFTGINPYSLRDNDVVAFSQIVRGLRGGGETSFLSGTYSRDDLLSAAAAVTVPSSLALVGLGILLLSHRNRGGAKLRTG